VSKCLEDIGETAITKRKARSKKYTRDKVSRITASSSDAQGTCWCPDCYTRTSTIRKRYEWVIYEVDACSRTETTVEHIDSCWVKSCMIPKESCVPNECQVAINSSDTASSYAGVRYEPFTITVVMCELIVLGYSNTSVMYNECSTKVFMEGTVN